MTARDKFDGIAWTSICAVISVLFAGNVFWAKKTVDRLDEIQSKVYELSEHVALIQQQIGTISSRASQNLQSQTRRLELLRARNAETNR